MLKTVILISLFVSSTNIWANHLDCFNSLEKFIIEKKERTISDAKSFDELDFSHLSNDYFKINDFLENEKKIEIQSRLLELFSEPFAVLNFQMQQPKNEATLSIR